MKILVTGTGNSGSWIIRGEQLGAAIGATVEPLCVDPRGYDLAILVKRPPMDLILRLQRYHIPIVYDIVDAWPQPQGNDWSERRCKAWLAERIGIIKPAAIVAATRTMAEDCAWAGVPVLDLPHHARPGLVANPVRERVKVVGYEGGGAYIGEWRGQIEAACAARGWEFRHQPLALADIDIVIAMRDQVGYAPRNWKSNVKLANAQGSGTPVICNREAGYLETLCGAERWADTKDELDNALDELTPHAARQRASEMLRKAAFPLEQAAQTYLSWLNTLR